MKVDDYTILDDAMSALKEEMLKDLVDSINSLSSNKDKYTEPQSK